MLYCILNAAAGLSWLFDGGSPDERKIGMAEKMSKNFEQEKEIQYEAKKTVKRRVWDYAVITAASFLYAAAVSLFLDPNSLAPGGVTGVSIILNRILGLETEA